MGQLWRGGAAAGHGEKDDLRSFPAIVAPPEGWNRAGRYNPAMHNIAILALHGVVPFDLSIPCEVFSRVRVQGIEQPYSVRVCGESALVKSGHFDIQAPGRLADLAGADTVIIPGIADIDAPVSPEATACIRSAAAAGTRIAAICSGTFILAATGLLDGRRATTHWLAAAELARRHPAIAVDANVLFIDEGQLLTSAGAAAGLDLCLHLVRNDYGAAVAADAARMAVMPLERPGGQAQFIVREDPVSSLALQPVLRWIEAQLHRPLTLAEIAQRAATSSRTISRRFLQQTGSSPLQWLLGARVRRAQYLLETTPMPVKQVAAASGFGSAATFRARFTRLVGLSPQAYRKNFQLK